MPINSKPDDIIGKRFGSLVVKERFGIIPHRLSEPDGPGRITWLCVCDCGKNRVVPHRSLRDMKAPCCGSEECRVAVLKARGYLLPKQLALHEPPVGKKFGRLTVIGYGAIRNGNKRHWRFRCECGREKDIRAAKVSRGEIVSCGCLGIEVRRAIITKYADKWQMLRNSVFAGYKAHAADRGFAFQLSESEFRNLIEQPCAYCGRDNVNRHRGFPHNGVDRIDSAVGYTTENCVACCKTCNIMKQKLSVEDFVAHIKLIVSHMGSR
jgi:hypothetical protein